MIEPTGYWTFFCNPRKWYIDEFLLSGNTEDTFAISEFHKDQFKPGHLGVIRVGHDKRTLSQLNGKQRLKRGIYAVVEILDAPQLRKSTEKSYWEDEGEGNEIRYRVKIRYLKNLLNKPILLDNLNLSGEEYDKYLIEGQQGSSMPLNSLAFEKILNIIGGTDVLDFKFNEANNNIDHIKLLEEQYKDSVPEVKERVSKYIERGTIAQMYKQQMGFKCQICDALGIPPYSFKKPNGEFYIEVHHVIPVSQLKAGSLSINNLITVCANHHRQLHYGKVILIENTSEFFLFIIDENKVKIKKNIFNS